MVSMKAGEELKEWDRILPVLRLMMRLIQGIFMTDLLIVIGMEGRMREKALLYGEIENGLFWDGAGMAMPLLILTWIHGAKPLRNN